MPADTVGRAVHKSFHPERSGDLVVSTEPYHVLSSPLGTGTSHGSAHPYVTHVPLIVYGAGVRPGARKDGGSPLAVAAILAEAAGVRALAGAEAAVPDGLFDRSPQ